MEVRTGQQLGSIISRWGSLLRPHSTCRHDLKIYSSDEGLVQMSAAAFAKGLLDLEGQLTPILMQLLLITYVDLVVHAAGPFEYADSKLLEAAIESKGFARCPKLYKNKAIAAGVPAITNAGANPGVSIMAASFIHNAQRESKGQPQRLRYRYFTTGSGGNCPGVKVDLQRTDGYNAAAIFSHERLAQAVRTATTAFVLAVLEETQPGVWYPEEWRRLTKVDAGSILTTLFAVSCSASMEDATSLDYVIYVFGYVEKTEVFDPKFNNWDFLCPPHGLEGLTVSSPVLPDPLNNCIFIYIQEINALYAYYPTQDRWELVIQDFKFWSNRLALEDGVIYMYIPSSENVIAAYDITRKERLDVVLSSKFDRSVGDSEYDDLLHLGNGVLCLVTYTHVYGTTPKTLIYTVKFRVQRRTGSPLNVIVTPISVKSYTIEDIISHPNFVALR
ncbi:hypothetical protein OROGR_025318 [Orobanche gracilis]